MPAETLCGFEVHYSEIRASSPHNAMLTVTYQKEFGVTACITSSASTSQPLFLSAAMLLQNIIYYGLNPYYESVFSPGSSVYHVWVG